MKALAKNPDDRPQTAEEFRSELLAVEKERRARRLGAQPRGHLRAAPPAGAQGHAGRSAGDQGQHQPRGPRARAAREPQRLAVGREGRHRRQRAAPAPVPSRPRPTTAPSTSPDRRAPGEGGSALAFKLATVVLVLLALALAGAYLFQMFNQPKEVFVPPGGQGAEHADDFKGPTWSLEVAVLNRRPGDALRLASDGDAAWHTGNSDAAIAKYLEAWRADQQPETALKLGELYFQQDRLAEAKGFWGRFQKDRPDSRANSYIDRMLPR